MSLEPPFPQAEQPWLPQPFLIGIVLQTLLSFIAPSVVRDPKLGEDLSSSLPSAGSRAPPCPALLSPPCQDSQEQWGLGDAGNVGAVRELNCDLNSAIFLPALWRTPSFGSFESFCGFQRMKLYCIRTNSSFTLKFTFQF